MSVILRFYDWCRRPSMIKINMQRPVQFQVTGPIKIVTLSAFVVIGILGAWLLFNTSMTKEELDEASLTCSQTLWLKG